jgi:hypothetical protein
MSLEYKKLAIAPVPGNQNQLSGDYFEDGMSRSRSTHRVEVTGIGQKASATANIKGDKRQKRNQSQ